MKYSKAKLVFCLTLLPFMCSPAFSQTVELESPLDNLSDDPNNGVGLGEVAQYAQAIETAFQPTQVGTWTLNNNRAVWQLELKLSNATSISLKIDNLYLPQSAELYLSDINNETRLGPYTQNDITENKTLWTPIVHGDHAVLELHLSESDYQSQAYQLKVSEVHNGFIEFWKTDFRKADGNCHSRVACSEGNDWQNEIRSVTRYTIQGRGACTGTLVNNTARDGTPYVLTARHCFEPVEGSGDSYADVATSVVAYWNYETSSCNGGPIHQTDTTVGATLKMLYEPSDTALIELNSAPLSSYCAYWAGWDNGPHIPNIATTIHHPAGEEKMISFENNPLRITFAGEPNSHSNGTYFRVGDWDVGSTEGGSSGGGLWNQNHYVVGTLLGGFAACGNNDADWYGRIASAWNGNGSTSGSLRPWLDPLNRRAELLNGQAFNNAANCSVAGSPSGGNGQDGSNKIDRNGNPVSTGDNSNSGSSGGGGATFGLLLLASLLYLRRRPPQYFRNQNVG